VFVFTPNNRKFARARRRPPCGGFSLSSADLDCPVDEFSCVRNLWKASTVKSRIGSFLLGLMITLSTLQAQEPTLPSATFSNVPYGAHTRQVLDFWKAPGDTPRPLVVYIHGGGWLTGDKTKKGPAIQPFLDRGISFAAVNYRLTPEHPLPAPVHDAARAIQFLRTKAAEWNVNSHRIALTGPSAGACTSMWLLLHDDLADPQASDPVLRESTRVCAASVMVGQTSIDPMVIRDWMGPAVLEHPMIASAVGEQSIEPVLKNYARYHALYAEFSPINHVDAKDPPLFMTCNAETDLPARDAGHGIHHPIHCIRLFEKSNLLGHECHLVVPGYSQSMRYSDGDDFLMKSLLAAE